MPFFQKGKFFFQISQSPKKLFQKTILSLKFGIPAHIISQILNSFKYCDLSFWISFIKMLFFDKKLDPSLQYLNSWDLIFHKGLVSGGKMLIWILLFGCLVQFMSKKRKWSGEPTVYIHQNQIKL